MSIRHELDLFFIREATARPSDFVARGSCTLLDKATGWEWWIANGHAFFGPYKPYELNGMQFFAWFYPTRRKAYGLAQKLYANSLIELAGPNKASPAQGVSEGKPNA